MDLAARGSFGLAENQAAIVTDWHRHARHQVLFAAQGSMSLEVESQRWLLPPQRAAFIAASIPHRTRSSHGVSLRTVYLDPGSIEPPSIDCRVFAVTPLAREMFLEACRFGPGDPPGTTPDEALRSSFFTTLGHLVCEWLTAEL